MAPATTFPFSETEYEMVKHTIDISDLEELKLMECSIYKVPRNLRRMNEEAYTPQLISIGPIHLGKKELKAMQEHKQRYFHFFWERVSNEQAMKDYKQYLQHNEEKIRQCYARNFPDISKEKFVDTILLDAVFIMELLLRNSSCKSDRSKHNSFRRNQRDDYILTQSWLSKNITRDLILLENQIPFLVLNELYDTVVPANNKKPEHSCFVYLALEYFAFHDTQMISSDETKEILHRNQSKKRYFSGSSKKSLDKSQHKDSCKKPKHFTDLIRYFYLPHESKLGYSGCPDRVLRTATKLQEAGVSFEKVLKRRLLDITFDKKPILSSFLCLDCLPYFNHFKARFRIPQWKVDHTTECVFRNLIAFEQCHYPDQPYICNYVSFVNSLIHTQVDVELLVEKEVIVHELGSYKEVATLVNGLCRQVVANTTCYYEVINELNKHSGNIWRACSTVVGITVVVFTVFNFLREIEFFNILTSMLQHI